MTWCLVPGTWFFEANPFEEPGTKNQVQVPIKKG